MHSAKKQYNDKREISGVSTLGLKKEEVLTDRVLNHILEVSKPGEAPNDVNEATALSVWALDRA